MKGEAIPPEQEGEGTMQQEHKLSEGIEQFLQSFNQEENGEPELKAGEEIEEIDVYFVRRPKKEEGETREDEERPPRQRPRRTIPFAALLALAVNVLLTLCVVIFVIVPELTATVTVTLVPKSEQLMATGRLQLGRILPPITLSQSQTVQTTGHGHQDAKQATGTLTFYNGQFQSVTIAAGTTLTGASGVQIATDQDATIPAESQTIPPILGQVTISAHALVPGIRGNIPPGDINQRCCAPSLLVQNTTSFHGGQDERNFPIVSKTDIDSPVTPMKSLLAQSMQGAFQGQVPPQEHLLLLPCTPTVTADHHPGAEATHIQVTVTQTCSAVAYNNDTLLQKATALLSTQARKQLGAGYSLLGDIQVTVNQATVTHHTQPIVISFTCVGTWVYALSQTAQQHIKMLVAGKTKQQALQLLLSQNGIASVTISGILDTKKLPDDLTHIHLFIIVEG